mmetsp:Transcript_34570/g.60703  ORF Transcript_34570/g.60703 Transcript_34570/m.60703 type:complete len:140 (-) Transcript_34570:19-438(-)
MLELCLTVVSRVFSGSMTSIIMQEEDIFDSCVRIEEDAYKRGFAQGRVMADVRDRSDSYNTGFARGSTIGRELGFYEGVVKALENEPLLPSQLKLLAKLSTACTQAHDDPSNLPALKGLLKHLLKALKATPPHWVAEEW